MLLHEFPWLTPEDMGQRRPVGRRRGSAAAAAHDADPEPPVNIAEADEEDGGAVGAVDVADVDVDALAAELLQVRDDYAHDVERELYFLRLEPRRR